MTPEDQYWFPAKRYGWGWGLPIRWQGWVVLVTYIATLLLSVFMFPPGREMSLFLAAVAVCTVVFAAMCWITGEPPRWRWGNEHKK